MARKVIPRKLAGRILDVYWRMKPPTVAAGWDSWARNSRYGVGAVAQGEHLGDQWSDPKRVGADVSAEGYLEYLDQRMIAPFFNDGGVVLEIGSGGGRMTQLLLRHCDRVIAADTARTMIRLLRQRFADRSNIEYLLLNGRGLSQVADRSLDKVFSFDVFVHLQPWDIFNYLQEIRRTLKPNGRAILHHSDSLTDLGWRVFLHDVPRNVGRHRLFDSFVVMTPELMREMATRAGLEVVEQRRDIQSRDCVTYLRSPA